jgi:PAS domain S-box-containing protein
VRNADPISLIARLADHASVVLFVQDMFDGSIVSINPAIVNVLGYTSEQIVAMDTESLARLSHPNDRLKIHGMARSIESAADTDILEYDLRVRHANGAWRTLLVRYTIYSRTSEGAPRLVYGMLSDISDRTTADPLLGSVVRRDRDFAQALVDTAPVIILLLDSEGRIQYINPFLEELSGWRSDEVQGKSWFDVLLPERDRERIRALFMTAVHEKPTRGSVNPIVTRAGEEIEIEWYDRIMRDDRGIFTGLLCIGQDVSQRRISEERLNEAQRIAKMGSWELDLRTDHLIWSPETYRIFEVNQERQSASLPTFRAHLHPEDREQLMAAYARSIETHQPYDFTHRLLMPDGRVKHVQERAETYYNAAGVPVRSIGTIQDITERTQLQEQLFEAQKLESIGKLAGGIAHDFNNLLAAISGYTVLAQESVEADSEVAQFLTNVQAAAQRASALTSQLLTYARRQRVDFTTIDLNRVILEMDPLLRRTIGERHDLSLGLQERVWTVRTNASQMEQVLMNLVVNARDAMPHGGRIRVETANVVLDAQSAASHPGIPPGEYTMLAVCDHGPGIAKEIQDRIFEPFFTTKEMGKGTGLGLATCFGIAKQSRGSITVHSEPGQGTTFRVYLPRLHATPVVEEAVPQEIAPTGSETILLVDDEPMVRDITARILRSQGYCVLEAGDAAQAILVQHEWDGEIDLLLTDVVMPQMGGKELAARLQQSQPDLKVMYLSGYAHDVILDQDILKPDVALINKPFTSACLLQTVREVLNSNSL